MSIDITEQKAARPLWSGAENGSGGAAGGLAHDFNNLLTVTVGDLGAAGHAGGGAGSRIVDPRCRPHAAARLIRRLLSFSRRQTLEPSRG